MSDYDSPLITVTVGPALPSYISSKTINSWIDVPNSLIAAPSWAPHGKNFPYSTFVSAGLIDGGGLVDYRLPDLPNTSGGIPLKSMWAFSGLWFRQANGELGQAATGGGRFCWNGNDITSIRVFDEAPAWTIRVPPRNVSQLYRVTSKSPPWTATPTPTLKDGSPNSRHTYYGNQFIDALDLLLLIGHKQNWQTDDTWFNKVQKWNYGAADWTIPSRETDLPLPGNPGYDNVPTTTDQATGLTYIVWSHDAMYVRNHVAQTCVPVLKFGSPPAAMSNGGVLLNNVRFVQGSVCHWRRSNGQHGIFGLSEKEGGTYAPTRGTFWMFEVSNGGVWRNLSNATGIPAGLQPFGNPESAPMCFDPVEECFYLWETTAIGQMYKLTTNFTDSLTVTAFTPATTYANKPQYDIMNGLDAQTSALVGQHLFVARNCLILAHNTRDPIKVIRLR